MKLGIYSNPHKDVHGSFAIELCRVLKEAGTDYFLCDKEIFSLDSCPFVPDAVIAFGGDGTMLRAVGVCAEKGIPILGVNLGKVGFLTEVDCKDVAQAAKKLISGDYFTERRLMLEIKCGEECFFALNEAALTGTLCRVAEITVEIDKTLADNVRADGVLVSTPTGSTAYSLACNGPVLSPEIEAFIVNAICPHSLHSCPIVVGSGSAITLKSASEGLNLVVDGSIVKSGISGAELQISKAARYAEFIRFSKQNFYNRLLHKLSNWS